MKFIITVKGVRVEYDINLGDIVLTYNGQLAQVRGIDTEGSWIRLNQGDWVDVYEVVPVRRLGWMACEVMKQRGRCSI